MRSTWSRILFSPQYHSNNFYFKLAVPFFTTIPSVAFSHMAGPSVVNMQSRKRPFLAGGGGRRAAVRRSTLRSGAGRRPGPDGALNPNAYRRSIQLFRGLFISSSNNADSDKFLQSSLLPPFFSFLFLSLFLSFFLFFFFFNNIIYQNKFIKSIQRPRESLAAFRTVFGTHNDISFTTQRTRATTHH